MNAFEQMLRETFGYIHTFQFLVVGTLEEILGPADEKKVEQLLDTLCRERNVKAIFGNQMMAEFAVEQGRAATIAYMKASGYQTINEALINAANLIKNQSQ